MTPPPGRWHAVAPSSAVPARAATAVSLAAATAAVAVEVAVGWGDRAWVPLLAGLLLGLPPTAVGLLTPHGPDRRLRRVVLSALGCAAVAAAVWLALRAAPGPALLVLVLVSVRYLGTAETAFADLRAGRPVQDSATASMVLGGLVLLVPLARGAGGTAPVLADVVPGGDAALPPAVVATVLAVVPLAAAALAVERLLAARWLEAAEVGVLLTLVLVVPPLAALGVWSGCWHGVRLAARLLAEDPRNDADLAVARLHRARGRQGGPRTAPAAPADRTDRRPT